MSILQISAVVFAAIALLLVFGWPLLVAGPHRRLQALATLEAKSLAGGLASLAISVILAPVLGAALISNADTAQFVANGFQNLSFGM